MKKRIILVLAVLAWLVPASAFAESGYDGGFFIKNAEETFNLRLTGRVQTKLLFDHDGSRDPALGDPNKNLITFQMRRALIGVSASYHDVVTTAFTLMHAVGSVPGATGVSTTFQNVNITGAYLSVAVLPEFVITAGMVGLPLDMATETSSKWYLLTEAPITMTQSDGIKAITPLRPSFGTPDGLGLNFSGGYWKWFYSLSVVNGAESNYNLNPDMKMSFGFRTGINILDPVPGSQTDFANSTTPKLTVSMGSDYQGKRTDASGSAIKYLWTSSLGVAVRWAGLAFTTEGYYRRTKITDIQGTDLQWARPMLTDIGYYAGIGYYIIPKKFEIAGQAGQIIRQGPDNNSWQFGGGLNYYIFDNNLKMQLAYTLTTDFDDVNGVEDKKIHHVALMASAIF
jgi:hypothetical protein